MMRATLVVPHDLVLLDHHATTTISEMNIEIEAICQEVVKDGDQYRTRDLDLFSQIVKMHGSQWDVDLATSLLESRREDRKL